MTDEPPPGPAAPLPVEAVLLADIALREALLRCWVSLPTSERTLVRLRSVARRRLRVALAGLERELQQAAPPAPDGARAGEPHVSAAQAPPAHPRLTNAYRPWTTEDDQRLRDAHARAEPLAALAAAFGRERSAIRARLRKLGLIT